MRIFLHKTLAADAKAPEAEIQLSEERKISELIEQMEVALEDVGIILKNGVWVNAEDYVGNNDKLELFPVLAGG